MTENRIAYVTGGVAVALGLLVLVGSLFVPTSDDPTHSLAMIGAVMVALPVGLLRAAVVARKRGQR